MIRATGIRGDANSGVFVGGDQLNVDVTSATGAVRAF
jgi:hypothetical protein